jgi:predicted amidophosphoribosyltransferase
VSPFAYDGAAREVLARLKYRNTRAALPWLALEVAAAVRAGSPRRLPDVVTWAPTTRTRRRGRGYDQGELLARAVAARLRIPARALLVRESGVAQTGRTRMARWSSPPRFRPVGPLARALTVLVIDDVATTGATLAAAAHALTEAGAARVVGATAARTPRAAHTVLPASTRAQARGE